MQDGGREHRHIEGENTGDQKVVKRILCLLAAVAITAAGAFADEKSDQKKAEQSDMQALGKAIDAGDKAAVLKELEALGKEGTEKAAKLIVTVALKADNLNKKFHADATNEIYDAAERALAQIKDPKAEEFIFKHLKDEKDVKTKVLLCDVVAKKPGDAAEAALISCLQDKSPLVQKDAVQQLGLRKSKKAFDGVIELLGKIEKRRDEPWLDCLRFLTSLSGKDLGTASEWKDWWAANKEKWDPAQVNPAANRQGAGVGETVSRSAPKLFGSEVLSKRCVFILDVSGSMTIKDPKQEAGQPRQNSLQPKDPGYGDCPIERMRMWRLKDAMKKVIEELPADTKFSIITFATNVRHYSKDLVDASAKNKQDAIGFAEGMQAEGFTVTDEAFRAAFDFQDANSFYFFSDGVPQRGKNADGTPQYIDKQEILSEIEQSNRVRKVKIYAFGIGEADPDFMRKIALSNGGSYVQVD
jgi:hypothetical protein